MFQDRLLCSGEGCKLRHYCFRNTAEILGKQDFFGTPPLNQQTQECAYFYENAVFEADIRLKAYELWLQEGQPEGQNLRHWHQARTAVLAFVRQQNSP